MDQQQATEFIQQQLQQGSSTDEIVQLLSPQLKAPPELVRKFVDKVAAQALLAVQPPPAASPAQSEMPDLVEPAAEPPVVEAAVAQPPIPATTAVPAEPVPAYTVVPKPVMPPARPPAARTTALDDPQLAVYVAKRLKAQRRKSDIAMEVCERTGADWKEAQRFVNQVNMEQYQSINRARNVPLLIFCGLFVFSGVVLLIVGAIDAIPYVTYFFGSPSDLSTLPASSIRSTVYYLLGGMGLLVGGLVGLYLALRPQGE